MKVGDRVRIKDHCSGHLDDLLIETLIGATGTITSIDLYPSPQGVAVTVALDCYITNVFDQGDGVLSDLLEIIDTPRPDPTDLIHRILGGDVEAVETLIELWRLDMTADSLGEQLAEGTLPPEVLQSLLPEPERRYEVIWQATFYASDVMYIDAKSEEDARRKVTKFIEGRDDWSNDDVDLQEVNIQDAGVVSA